KALQPPVPSLPSALRADDTEVRNPGRRATRRNRQRRQTRIPPGTDSVSARGTFRSIYYCWIRPADSGMVPADRSGRGARTNGAGADAMPTTLKTAAESYLRAKALSRATRNEYLSTLRKWETWGGGIPIEQLRRKDLREFLDRVYEQAVKDEGENPGRTANK